MVVYLSALQVVVAQVPHVHALRLDRTLITRIRQNPMFHRYRLQGGKYSATWILFAIENPNYGHNRECEEANRDEGGRANFGIFSSSDEGSDG